MSGFTKLWSEIITSSIWNEDAATKIVWVTMLAMMGPDFIVRASVGGLAHQARVTREECQKALEKLQSPDEDSRTEDHEGRRIRKVEGGFFIINGQKYREGRDDGKRREYMRDYMRRYRREGPMGRDRVNANVNTCKPRLAQAEAEEELTPLTPREIEQAVTDITRSKNCRRVGWDCRSWVREGKNEGLSERESLELWAEAQKAGWKDGHGKPIACAGKYQAAIVKARRRRRA